MRTAPFRRLQWKLTLSYALVTTIGVFFFVVAFTVATPWLLRGSDLAQVILPPLRYAVPLLIQHRDDSLYLQTWLRHLVREHRVDYIDNASLRLDLTPARITWAAILDADGTMLALEPPTACSDHTWSTCPLLANLPPKWKKPAQAGHASQVYPQGAGFVLFLPLTNGNAQPQGALLVRVAWPAHLSEWLAALGNLLDPALVGTVFITSLVIGAVFGYAVTRNLTRRLNALGRAIQAWSRGDFSTLIHDATPDELGVLTRQLNTMAEQLQDLLQTREDLAALSERHRLARELHDAVKQLVFSAEMQLAVAAHHLSQGAPEQAYQAVHEAQALLKQTQHELQALIRELRPSPTQEFVPLLRDYLQNWEQRTGIPVHFQVNLTAPWPQTYTRPLLRVVQEALSNVARHSQARQVWVQVESPPEAYVLRIRDDGRGFHIQNRRRGFGLVSMSERVTALGGELHIHTAPGQGTEIQVVLPRGGNNHEPAQSD